MKLSENIKKRLLDEIQTVRTLMVEEENPRNKMFFYSGLYAEISRLYNVEYNPHLNLIHLIINVSYSSINNRLNAIVAGDTTVVLPKNFFDELDKLLEKLQRNIEKDEDTYSTLEKIANLTYLTTGNGYYLSQKGVKVYSP